MQITRKNLSTSEVQKDPKLVEVLLNYFMHSLEPVNNYSDLTDDEQKIIPKEIWDELTLNLQFREKRIIDFLSHLVTTPWLQEKSSNYPYFIQLDRSISIVDGKHRWNTILIDAVYMNLNHELRLSCTDQNEEIRDRTPRPEHLLDLCYPKEEDNSECYLACLEALEKLVDVLIQEYNKKYLPL